MAADDTPTGSPAPLFRNDIKADTAASFSEDQLREMEADVLRYAPESIEKWRAAVRSEGARVPEPIDVAEQALSARYMLAPEGRPTKYDIDPYSVEGLPGDGARALSGLPTWLSKMRFEGNLGSALAAHLIRLGPQIGRMTPDQRSAWATQCETANLQHCGSEEALAKMRDEARKALAIAGPNELSSALANGIATADSWLLKTLSGHFQRHQLYLAARAKAKK